MNSPDLFGDYILPITFILTAIPVIFLVWALCLSFIWEVFIKKDFPDNSPESEATK